MMKITCVIFLLFSFPFLSIAISDSCVLVAKEGYPCEAYDVTTSDGYILKLHRIPGSPASPPKVNKTIVFIHHGILMTSSTWLVMGKSISLPYLLADLGFDVWVANARGNSFSNRHVSLNPGMGAFWKYSVDESGDIDLPAMLNKTLTVTNMTRVHYIGYSAGTTAFFMMCSEHPDMNSKIISMHALAPVAIMTHATSLLHNPFLMSIVGTLNSFELGQVLNTANELAVNTLITFTNSIKPVVELLQDAECKLTSPENWIKFSPKFSPAISAQFSYHFYQMKNAKRFCKYDYGKDENIKRYGVDTPPDYNLTNVKAPVYLYYAAKDGFSHLEDVDTLATKLGTSLKEKNLIAHPDFTHVDLFMADNAKTLVYDRVIANILSY